MKNSIIQNTQAKRIETDLEELPPRIIGNWIQHQQLNVSAIVLSLMRSEKVSAVLKTLATELQVSLCRSVAELAPISNESLETISDEVSLLKQNFALKEHSLGGADAATKLLAGLEPDKQKQIMSEITERNPTLAKEIYSKILSLEKISTLLPKDLELVCRNLIDRDLALALKIESEKVRSTFLNAVSKSRQESLSEMLNNMGPTRKSEVMGAQQKICELVTRLHTENSILFPWEEPLV